MILGHSAGSTTANLAQAVDTTVGEPLINIAIFVAFVAVTMFVVIRASKKNATASEFFTAGGGFSGPQNGVAIAGDYLSAASFLGIAGAIAVYGYDGFLYSIGFLVAWLVALLLVAELLRNTGKFTMADVLSFRLKQRPVRTAAAISTLTSRCSTSSRRWQEPAASSHCSSTSPTAPVSRSSSRWSACS